MRLQAQQVIDRLKEIQVERVRLIQEERQLLSWLERTTDIQRATGQPQQPNREPPSLAQLEVLDGISVSSDASYGVGDIVYIKSKLGALAPTGRRANLKDKTAVITAVEDEKIYLKNFDGKESWRVAKSLRPLTPQEEDQLEYLR